MPARPNSGPRPTGSLRSPQMPRPGIPRQRPRPLMRRPPTLRPPTLRGINRG
jgi:hypothetical protein